MKPMQLSYTFTFDAAHHLTEYHGKCERVHGHTYTLEVTVSGLVQKNGLLMDFALLKAVVQEEVLSKLDHRDLNTVIKNPTAENIALWIFKKLKPLPRFAAAQLKSKKYEERLRKYFDGGKITPNVTAADCKKLKLASIKLCETPRACVTVSA